jgi:phospholipid/cholesterol/gamma-HCH transport system substrate-binding protein
MEPEARYTIVGAVVLVLLAMLAGAVLWLHGSSAGPQARAYRIVFERQSLEGLSRSSDVTMRGLRVGSVTSYRFSPQKAGAVEVSLALDPGAPVQEGTRAVVGRNLLTGLASVQLNNPAVQGRPLRAAPGGAPPTIAEGQAPEQQMAASVTELAQRLNTTLSVENRAAFSETLANVRLLSGHAERTLARLDTALDALTGATRRVGDLSTAIQADAAILTARYDQLGAQAVHALGEASAAVRSAGADVGGLARRTDALLESSDRDIQATTRSLREAAQSAGIAADRLREPSELLYGPGQGKLGPGEGPR